MNVLGTIGKILFVICLGIFGAAIGAICGCFGYASMGFNGGKKKEEDKKKKEVMFDL